MRVDDFIREYKHPYVYVWKTLKEEVALTGDIRKRMGLFKIDESQLAMFHLLWPYIKGCYVHVHS